MNKEKEQYLSFPGNQDELNATVPSTFSLASSCSLVSSSSLADSSSPKTEDSSPTRTLEIF